MRGQRHASAALYPREIPVLIVQEAGWAPGMVWTGAENLAPNGIRSPDRPARSQSLYRLRYPAHDTVVSLRNLESCSDTTVSLRNLEACSDTTVNHVILSLE